MTEQRFTIELTYEELDALCVALANVGGWSEDDPEQALYNRLWEIREAADKEPTTGEA